MITPHLDATPHLSWAAVRSALHTLGVTLRSTVDGEYVVRVRGAASGEGYPHLGDAGTGQYEQRVDWLSDWLCALRDRLCECRIACGDFERVLGDSCTVKQGLTGVFLDPPYAGTEYVYGTGIPVSERVRNWCASVTDEPKLRVVLAGRGTEHDALLPLGWSRETWTARRGYSKETNTGRFEEALWVSPSCAGRLGVSSEDLYL